MSDQSREAGIKRFVDRVVPQMLSDGQGHDSLDVGGLVYDAAWYRETEHTWMLCLAAEQGDKRVETPPQTGFSCDPGYSEDRYKSDLTDCLSAEYRSITAQL